MTRDPVVDIHAHVWPSDYLDRLEAEGMLMHPNVRTLAAGTSEAELVERFEDMEHAAVDVQVVSVATSLPIAPRKQVAVDLARRLNDSYAQLVHDHPGKLRALAHLPHPHADASLSELERALDSLGCVGVATTSSIMGVSIADEMFAPVLEELDRRCAFLLVHPAADPGTSPLLSDLLLATSVGPPVEDTIVVAHLIVAGIPLRYPNLKILVPHFGGATPLLLERFDRQLPHTADESAAATARRLWYDTVSHNSAPAFRCALETLGADRLVFGSDWPVLRYDAYREAVLQVAELAGSHADGILRSTAAALIAA